MSKRQVLIILGIVTMAFLFLGIPALWDKVLALIIGVVILIVALRMRSPQRPILSREVPYVDHRTDAPETAPTVSPTITNPEQTTIA